MAPSGASTPVAAMAPTPLSMSFQKANGESASNHGTPTSASSGKGKKNKRMAGGDDSETDSNTKETAGNKKARTNFGAVRK
ncbi:chromatin modification- protein eaf6 [Ciborinia camelliae]|nr:chromatin modification- protein eaf6 [Ciborinia camelliae]